MINRSKQEINSMLKQTFDFALYNHILHNMYTEIKLKRQLKRTGMEYNKRELNRINEFVYLAP